MRYLITGTGRCGTGYVAKVLSSAGVTCTHEGVFRWGTIQDAYKTLQRWADEGRTDVQAESSWMAAPFLDDPILKDVTIIHLVRHPFDVIRSHIRMRNWQADRYAGYNQFAYVHLPGLREIADPVIKSAYMYVGWNAMIEPHAHVFHRVEDDVRSLLDKLGIEWRGKELFSNTRYNHRSGEGDFTLEDAERLPDKYRLPLFEIMGRYGYSQSGDVRQPRKPTIKAIITTMDNLPNNQAQLAILRADPLVDQIIFVNQDSVDGTREWLDQQSDVIAIHRVCPGGEGRGAGPGRNAGLDAAGDFDFVLMLDGGIRPLRGGTRHMLDWLLDHPKADAICTDWHFLETDQEKADLRWPEPIRDAYRQWTLSETHYGLFRRRCWEGFRFAEHYPFGWAGWGADDDEMMHRWHEAGIHIWVTPEVRPYRRGSGSFRRLFQETGIWPNQYGSNYEERVVWLMQEQPQHGKGLQWGEPWLTVVVKGGRIERTAKLIKSAHDQLRRRHLDYDPNVSEPYSVILWTQDADLLAWAEVRRLRQHHGDTIIEGGQIIRRTPENEETWVGDFRVWTGEDWEAAVRPGAFYYGLVESPDDLDELVRRYDEAWPPSGRDGMTPEYRPKERRRLY